MSYSVNEAAKLVGKNPRKIKLDIRQGKLEASRLGDKPNSAYRIEYKDLRKTYSTSFEPQASGDGAQMSGPQGDAGPDVTGGLPQPAVPEDRSVLGGQGEDEILEDEPDILRAALAREVRNNRIIQKQLTDAVKRIERLLSGQVARGNTSMPPLTLEPHMRPSGPLHHSIPETRDTDASMTPVTNSEVSENLTSAAETASSNMSAELAPVSNTTTNTPEVDHVPVLSSVLAEDPKPKPKLTEAEAENAAEKHKKQHKKSPVTEMSSVSHDDEELHDDDNDEIPVNELIKNYQARLDASLDMIRNLRAD
ncbi:MAG: hypothetical protein CMH03_05930 [Marinovum sp.]|nr:hypothetical protein [Marinovum sp.]